jgi:hypothetical protein
VHWSATRKPSGTGSECAGHSLKKALCERRTIVFIDESGLSERPPRVRTWAPRGPTPVLQYHFNWKVLSVIDRQHLVELLFPALSNNHLRPTGGGLPYPSAASLAGPTAGNLGSLQDSSQPPGRGICRRPAGPPGAGLAYAPELNPVEYIWGYWKHHELPNFCPHDFSQLSYHARHTLRRMRRRPMLVIAFWQQANLFPLYYARVNRWADSFRDDD